MQNGPEEIEWGCAKPKCFRAMPSTLPTNYQRCPVCGDAWVSRLPKRTRRLDDRRHEEGRKNEPAGLLT